MLNETGEKTGTKQLDLKFAGESSKGLVHRYVVHVLRNQVSLLRKRQKRDRKGLPCFFFFSVSVPDAYFIRARSAKELPAR